MKWTTLTLLILISVQYKPVQAREIDNDFRLFHEEALIELGNGEIAQSQRSFERALQAAVEQDSIYASAEMLKSYGRALRDQHGEPVAAAKVFALIDEIPKLKSPNRQYWELLASIYVNWGYTLCSERLNDFTGAIHPYKAALRIYDEQLHEESLYTAIYVYRYLGNIYTRLGELSAAESLLQRALSVFQREEDLGNIVVSHSDLALLYENWNKPESAETQYRLGLQVPLSSANTARCQIMINYSDFLLETGNIDLALQQLQLAREIYQINLNSQDPNPRAPLFLSNCYLKEAAILQEQNNPDLATRKYERGIELLRSYLQTDYHREIGKANNSFGQFYLKYGEITKALDQFQQALTTVLPSYQPVDPTTLPTSDIFFAENTIIEALSGMSSAYERLHTKTNELKYLELALDCHNLIYAAEQELRRSYLYETSKLLTMEESRERSEQAIALAIRLFNLSGDTDYQRAAFVFAERSRGTLLKEAFHNSRANDLAGVSTEQRAAEAELQFAVNQAEEKLFDLHATAADNSLIQLAEQEVLRARNALTDWIQNLEADNPRYYQLKYNDAVPTLADIQSMLSRGQVMIEYFLGDETLYTFVISADGLQIISGKRPDQLLDRVLAFRQSIEGYQWSDADRASLIANYQLHGLGLYQDLIAPLRSLTVNADQLLIIPSGILDLLPFEALLSGPADKPNDFRSYPYLLHDYVISYGYSAGLQWGLHQLSRSEGGWAGYAPAFDGSQGWERLSCSQELLGSLQSEWNGETFLSERATRQFFTEHARRFSVLHLATHAQSNPDAGDFSFVVFADGQGGYDSLFTKDLYLLDLEAELVLLSACETALGTLYQSEGVISLARGFHYAGARSVLTTLWSINEGANCHLMESFYEQLREGENKSMALRTAKLAYLDKADVRSAHPVYWAGFQLLGNPRPLEAGGISPWWALVLLIPAGFLLYQRRQKEPSSARKSLASA